METCRKYAPDFDLMTSLVKLIKGQSIMGGSPQKLIKTAPKYKQSASAIRPDKRGKPYGIANVHDILMESIILILL